MWLRHHIIQAAMEPARAPPARDTSFMHTDCILGSHIARLAREVSHHLI